MSSRNPILDKVIPMYMELMAKTGINIPVRPLIVYSLLPKYEKSNNVQKYLNRVSGLTWESIFQQFRWLHDERYIEFGAFAIKFTHSIDALMIDEKLNDVGCVRPVCVPNQMIRKADLHKKYFHLTKEQIAAIGPPDEISEHRDRNKQFHTLYKIQHVYDFMKANKIDHPLITDWKDNYEDSEKGLLSESARLLRDGEVRYLESFKTKTR